MRKEKELIKATLILMAAKVSTQVVNFFLLPMYTALLSEAEYGEIDIYSSLSMIVIPFLTLQLEMGLFRFFITAKKDEQKKYVSTSLILVLGVTSVVSLIYFVIANIVHLNYVILIFFYYISIMISTYLLQLCRAQGDNAGYGIGTFLSSSCAVVLNILFVSVIGFKVKGVILSSIIAQLVCAVFLFFRTKIYRYFSFKEFDKNACRSLLNYSAPLVFNQISSWAINFSDRIIIVSFLGIALNGIYAVANKLSNIINTFFGVFNLAWTENVVRSMNDSDSNKYINKMFLVIFQIYLAGITGIINVLPFMFGFLVNENYNDAYAHVPILLLAMFFSGLAATIGSIYIAYGKTKEISFTTFLAGVCNVLVHLLMINRFGLYAASVSTLVSFGLLFFYRLFAVKKFFDLHSNIGLMIPQAAIYILSWVSYIIENKILILVCLAINLGFVGFIFVKNRQMIKNFLKSK